MAISFGLGTAGISKGALVTFDNPFVDGVCPSYKPGGGWINATKARDVGNTDSQTNLRPGLLMAYNSTNNDWSNFVIGTLTSAVTSAGTTLSLSAAAVTEINRSVGSSGTLTLTGPPTASGTARQMTATFSAASGTSVTITALGVNEVQTVNLITAATGGSGRLIVPKPDGTMAITPAIAWNATDATFLASINTALDTATGVVGGIVATAIAATDTDLGFVLTFSGTGYAALPQPMVEVHTLWTSNTGSNVVRTTTGVDGRFIAGSFVSHVDYDTTITLIKEPPQVIQTGMTLLDWPRIPMAGYLNVAKILDYPTDTGLQTWLRDAMSTTSGRKFTFSDVV